MVNDRKESDETDALAIDRLPRWLRDFIDLNNENAGRETGRIKRFSNGTDPLAPETREKEDRRRFSALLRMLTDPIYAQLYQDAVETVSRADRAATQAMRTLALEGDRAAQRLEQLRHNAAELPGGRKVFRGENGQVVTEDGKDVTDQKAQINGLSATTPTWQEFRNAQQQAEDIQRREDEVETYRRDVLEPAQRRLSDPENPLSADELRELTKRINEAAPPDVQVNFKNAAAPDPKPDEAPLSLGGPDLSSEFRAVRDAATPAVLQPAGATPKPG